MAGVLVLLSIGLITIYFRESSSGGLHSAQSAGATVYDLFLSTAAAPLWVARITETQRAAGVTITAVGTVSATSPGAGKELPGHGQAAR